MQTAVFYLISMIFTPVSRTPVQSECKCYFFATNQSVFAILQIKDELPQAMLNKEQN